jgi:hypothetical protein
MNYSNVLFKTLIAALLMVPAAGILAMEKPSFTDYDGKEVTLNLAQKEIFDKLPIANPGMIDFQGTYHFLTAHNILSVLNIAADASTFGLGALLDAQGQERQIELFEVADYLTMPEMVEELAERICGPLNEKIKALEKELKANKRASWWPFVQEPVDSNAIKEMELSLQRYKKLFESAQNALKNNSIGRLCDKRPAFIKKYILTPNLNVYEEKNGKLVKTSEPTLDLSFKTLEKETRGTLEPACHIESLEGLAKIIALNPDFIDIEILDLSGHKIKDFSLDEMKQIFPCIKKVNLSGNAIAHVDNDQINASINEINLSNNPIRLLSIQDPSQFNATKIIISGNCFNDGMFKEDKFDKIKAWLKALGAKTKIAVKSFMTPLEIAEMCVFLGLAKYSDLIRKFKMEDNVKFFKEYLAEAIINGMQPELANKIMERNLEVANESVDLLAAVIKCASVGAYLLLQWDHRNFIRSDFQQALQQAARDNPYAVALENDEAGYEFPSDEKRAL